MLYKAQIKKASNGKLLSPHAVLWSHVTPSIFHNVNIDWKLTILNFHTFKHWFWISFFFYSASYLKLTCQWEWLFDWKKCTFHWFHCLVTVKTKTEFAFELAHRQFENSIVIISCLIFFSNWHLNQSYKNYETAWKPWPLWLVNTQIQMKLATHKWILICSSKYSTNKKKFIKLSFLRNFFQYISIKNALFDSLTLSPDFHVHTLIWLNTLLYSSCVNVMSSHEMSINLSIGKYSVKTYEQSE